MVKNISSFILIALVIIGLAAASVEIGIDDEDDTPSIDIIKPTIPTNFSIINTNSSDFWDLLDTPADIQDARWNVTSGFDTNASRCDDGDYLDGDGLCKDINETIDLRATLPSILDVYNASVIDTETGTLDSGNLESVKVLADGDTYNVSEVSGVPGFLININFTNVISFNTVALRGKYDGGGGHTIALELYRIGVGWEERAEITDQTDFGVTTFDVFIGSNFVDGDGTVQFRINHDDSGVIAHDYSLDAVFIGQVSAIVTSGSLGDLTGRDEACEVLPDVFCKDGTKNMTGNLLLNPEKNVTATWGFFDYLGSVLNKITRIFTEDIRADNATITNLTVTEGFTASLSSTSDARWNATDKTTLDEAYDAEAGTKTITMDSGNVFWDMDDTGMLFDLASSIGGASRFKITKGLTLNVLLIETVAGGVPTFETIGIKPFTDAVHDLGTNTKRWRDIFSTGWINTTGSVGAGKIQAREGDFSQNITAENITANEVTTTYGFYHDRGDILTVDLNVTNLVTNGSYIVWNLSSIVPEDTKSVLLRVAIRDNAADSFVLFRKKGVINNINTMFMETQVAGQWMQQRFILACDSNQMIEYRIEDVSWIDVQVTVVGWFK